MSQLTITTLRFQRSTSAPPSGASNNPGSMRATITRPTAAAEFDTLAAMFEDREQADPVAEARHELRAEQRKEPRNAEHAPRCRRYRVAVGGRRNERRLVAHEGVSLGAPTLGISDDASSAGAVGRRPSSVAFFAAFLAGFFAAFFVVFFAAFLAVFFTAFFAFFGAISARARTARRPRAT